MPKSARVSLSTLEGSEEDVRKLLGDSEHIAGNQCQFTQSGDNASLRFSFAFCRVDERYGDLDEAAARRTLRVYDGSDIGDSRRRALNNRLFRVTV